MAYMLGSFPSGVVLGLVLTGRDVRDYGSGNIGAANVMRAAGFKVGSLVGLVDILKGLVPILIGRWLGLDPLALALIGCASVLGHDFSIFLRFHGGKGVATTLGAALVLAPVPTLLATLTWLVVLALWRISSLASLSALGTLPVFMALMHEPQLYTLATLGLFILSTVKHYENIIRLAQGTEPSFKRRPVDDK